MKKTFIFIVAGVVIIIGYYLISPLFINIYLNEEIPDINRDKIVKDISTEPMQVTGTAGHPASGTVRVLTSEDKNYLRYENFKTINGPDIYIYLAKDLDAKEYVSLGRVKATEGNINYEIPKEIDPKEYPYAMVWCKAFGVLFNSAKLY